MAILQFRSISDCICLSSPNHEARDKQLAEENCPERFMKSRKMATALSYSTTLDSDASNAPQGGQANPGATSLISLQTWYALFKHPGHAPLVLDNPSAEYQLQMVHSIWQPNRAKQLLSATRQTALPCRALIDLVQSFLS